MMHDLAKCGKKISGSTKWRVIKKKYMAITKESIIEQKYHSENLP